MVGRYRSPEPAWASPWHSRGGASKLACEATGLEEPCRNGTRLLRLNATLNMPSRFVRSLVPLAQSEQPQPLTLAHSWAAGRISSPCPHLIRNLVRRSRVLLAISNRSASHPTADSGQACGGQERSDRAAIRTNRQEDNREGEKSDVLHVSTAMPIDPSILANPATLPPYRLYIASHACLVPIRTCRITPNRVLRSGRKELGFALASNGRFRASFNLCSNCQESVG